MVDEADKRNVLSVAYAEATKRLRSRYKSEFKALLYEVYEERGVNVRRRRSKEEILADRIAEAKRLLADQ